MLLQHDVNYFELMDSRPSRSWEILDRKTFKQAYMLGKFNDFGIFLIFLDYELSYSLSHSLYNLASGVHEMLRSLNLPFLHNQSLFYTQSTFFWEWSWCTKNFGLKSSIYTNSSLSYRLFEIGSLNLCDPTLVKRNLGPAWNKTCVRCYLA